MTLLPVLAGPALLLAAGYAVTVITPATATVNTHRTADTTVYTKGALKGHRLYAANGCVSCHTMGRRDSFADAGLGPAVSGPAERLNDAAGLGGEARYGPDLSCVGDRMSGVDAMVAYLQQPSSVHHGTTMPSYRVLSTTDLEHLAEYLLAQTCGETK